MYNGWTNYETWNANLSITNNEVSYKCLMMCNDENGIRGIYNEFFGSGCECGLQGINLNEVNWLEIFNASHGE